MLQSLSSIPRLESCGVALGFFDGIHRGHAAVVAAAFGGEGAKVVLTVGKKGLKPLFTREETARQLEKAGAELLVAPDFDQIKDMTGEQFVSQVLCERMQAKKVACGENYRFGVGASCGAQELLRLCADCGIECEIVPLVMHDGEVISSTAIRSALSEGDVRRTKAMLGRWYSYKLPVVSGQHLGRRFGTPTINQTMPENVFLPRFGVYASLTHADGRCWQSVTNIGVRPTVGSDSPVSETWLQDFSGDLYDRDIRVELVEFLRPERQFESLEALQGQIISDGIKASLITGEICQNSGR